MNVPEAYTLTTASAELFAQWRDAGPLDPVTDRRFRGRAFAWLILQPAAASNSPTRNAMISHWPYAGNRIDLSGPNDAIYINPASTGNGAAEPTYGTSGTNYPLLHLCELIGYAVDGRPVFVGVEKTLADMSVGTDFAGTRTYAEGNNPLQGEMLWYNVGGSSNATTRRWLRLPIGSPGQVLRVVAAAGHFGIRPEWCTPPAGTYTAPSTPPTPTTTPAVTATAVPPPPPSSPPPTPVTVPPPFSHPAPDWTPPPTVPPYSPPPPPPGSPPPPVSVPPPSSPPPPGWTPPPTP